MIPIGLVAILWLEQPAAEPVLIPTSVVLTAPPRAVQAVKQPIPPTSSTSTINSSIVSVSSTSYCQSGIMADGQMTHMGAAAGNMWPLGTRLEILSGSHQGTSVTIEDVVGIGSFTACTALGGAVSTTLVGIRIGLAAGCSSHSMAARPIGITC